MHLPLLLGFLLVAAYDQAGALAAFELGDREDSVWEAVAATGDGGLALVGMGFEKDMLVSRLGADLSPQWMLDAGGPGASSFAVAARPGGALAHVGYEIAENTAFVRRLDGDGVTVWSDPFVAAGPDGDRPMDVELGPGFVVGLGLTEVDGAYAGIWVRRYGD